MRYEILHGDSVVNTIVVRPEVIVQLYPQGNYRQVKPDPTPEPEPTYQTLTRLEFETHAQTAAGLTDAQFLAALQDPNLALLWHRLSISTSVDRDSDLTKNGLTSMVSAGHLTEAQVVIINDTWPTE